MLEVKSAKTNFNKIKTIGKNKTIPRHNSNEESFDLLEYI